MEKESIILEGKTDDEIIAAALTMIYRNAHHNYREKLRNIRTIIPKERYKFIVDKMFSRNLIFKLMENMQLTGFGDGIELTKDAIKIMAENNGNYLSYLGKQKRTEKQIITKNLVTTVIPIASLIVAIIFGILNYTKGKEIERKDLIIKTQSETNDRMKNK